MNTLAKITAVLLALTLLALPVVAAETEGEHGYFVVSISDDHSTLYLKYIPPVEHEAIPEHMELRPYFRDSDPELVIIDAGDPLVDDLIAKGAIVMMPDTVLENSAGSMTYEYAAVP
ncbi:hypothetical protein [Methanorbis furvi]|uniref:Uncharacterized protein n=1 Tax=Methanorbis furvi TaxID=3028299 RepID=A0AAE4MD02_9EURY|nr:hypothetical protein [Methanocorpusculaceae archaeon Ag1]